MVSNHIFKCIIAPIVQVFEQRCNNIYQRAGTLNCTCFGTSIWDETLYKVLDGYCISQPSRSKSRTFFSVYQAWSSIVYSLIPNIKDLESHLDEFCEICDSDEVVLFERATFLVIATATRTEHRDVHRFEKVSNIIKQFKLSCR